MVNPKAWSAMWVTRRDNTICNWGQLRFYSGQSCVSFHWIENLLSPPICFAVLLDKSHHHWQRLLPLLLRSVYPSGKQSCCIRCRTTRLCKGVVPQGHNLTQSEISLLSHTHTCKLLCIPGLKQLATCKYIGVICRGLEQGCTGAYSFASGSS